MEENDGTVAVNGGGLQVVRTTEEDDGDEDISMVETKGLLRASLSDAWPIATTDGYSISATLTEQANDGWLLLRNAKLISIARRCILPGIHASKFVTIEGAELRGREQMENSTE
uniref:Uncharacterized protein n=1 Tax=Oryza punctata TaxID=4537 RepID=A0A0E0LTH1_ORYPU